MLHMTLKRIFISTPALLLLLASCKQKQNKPPVLPPTPVYVASATTGEAIYYDEYQATVVALNSVELRSEVSGFITGIFFKEGEVVPKGKELYEIDRRKYEAAYQQAQANLESANANLVKAKKDIDRYNMLLQNDALRSALSEAARSEVSAHFSWRAAAGKTLAVYAAAGSG